MWNGEEVAKVIQVKDITELETAIKEAKDGDTIKLTADISSNIISNKLVNIDLNGKTLTGNISITSESEGTLDISAGESSATITGNLTVDAKNATVNVNENVTVSGDTNIKNVSEGTFNNKGNLNKIIISDPDGGSFNNIGQTGNITISPSSKATAPIILKGIIDKTVSVEGTNEPKVSVEGIIQGVITVDADSAELNIDERSQIDETIVINETITVISKKSVSAKIASGKEINLKSDKSSQSETVQGTGNEATITSENAKKSSVSTVKKAVNGDKIVKNIEVVGDTATITLNNIKDIKVIDFLDSIKATDDSIQDYDVVGRKVDTLGQIFQGRKSPFWDFMETGDEFRVRSQDRSTNLTYKIVIDGQEKPKSSRATITVHTYPNSIVTDINNRTFSKTIDVVAGTTGAELLGQIESTDGSDQNYELYEVVDNNGTLLDNKVKLVQGYVLRVTAEDGKAKEDYTINVAEEAKSSKTTIKAKSKDSSIIKKIEQIIDQPKVITVAKETTVSQLISSIESEDGSTQSYRVLDTDGKVKGDTETFTTPNYLEVTSADSKNKVNYQIKYEIIKSSNTDIKVSANDEESIIVDNDKNIIEVTDGLTIQTFLNRLNSIEDGKLQNYEIKNKTTGNLESGDILIVTAEDKISTQEYTITVKKDASPGDIAVKTGAKIVTRVDNEPSARMLFINTDYVMDMDDLIAEIESKDSSIIQQYDVYGAKGNFSKQDGDVETGDRFIVKVNGEQFEYYISQDQ